ncbi:uncharacterized protein LOC122252321 [Penaeus japonicus]|uniref:uncharacterized protein LOC122252321 n=1 Tax=Penaeus japonicus TaxID=27405 RepID=UPI001C7112E9|nr:uncharacterized protein LOC122252321 [Penaeus japonicus]
MEYGNADNNETTESGRVLVAQEGGAFMPETTSVPVTTRAPRRRARPRAPAATGLVPVQMQAPGATPFGFPEGSSNVAASPQALAFQYLVRETQNLREENASLQQRLDVFQHLIQNRERLVSVLRTLGMDAHIADPSS